MALSGCAGKAFGTETPAVFSNGVFRITTGGRYVLSGVHEGQVLIEAARNDVVELVLNGLTLHNPNGPAIFAPRSRRVELILTDRTTNTISDGRHPNDETNAAIYIRHDLIISGNGALNVNGNHRHGIRTQDFLTINSGVINVTAAGDTLRGRDGVIIENGEFTLNAGRDGIRSTHDTNPERGFITINGGTFYIRAGDDGMQAESTVTINGGNFRITTEHKAITTKGPVFITGGTINVTDCYEGIEGLNITITGGNIDIIARDDGINPREHGAGAGKNVRGSRRPSLNVTNHNIFLRITGGNINVRSISGDGIDSKGHFYLEGGTVQITGPFGIPWEDAIDVKGNFVVTGGELITAGGITGRSVSSQSRQPVLIFPYSRQLPAGTSIEMRDARGNVLLSYSAKGTFNVSTFTSPSFVIGGTYSLYTNGEKAADITLNDIITNLAGDSLNNHRGGGRGRSGGGGNIDRGRGGRGGRGGDIDRGRGGGGGRMDRPRDHQP